MTDTEGHAAGWPGYRSIGLVANPFATATATQSESAGIRLAVRAAAMRALGAVEESLMTERPRPVRVLKSSQLPSYYARSATTVLLRELGAHSETGLLPVYVPLVMMRRGRIRGTLSVLAEMVVGRSVDLTLARYAHGALSEPDVTLEEWAALEGMDLAVLVTEFAEQPAAAAERLFGAPVDVRDEDEIEALTDIMRDTGVRQAHQPTDPAEDDDSSEEDATDRLEALIGAGEPDSPQEGAEQDAGEPQEDIAARESAAVARYVIAHLKKHMSPVLARALRSYVKSGTAAMTQELKVTRAPRKTLGALARLARLTFRSVVIVYDGFEAWADVPDDLKVKIVSGLSEIRFALGPNGVIVICGSDAEAPEIDDQFANAIRVPWAMDELERVQDADARFDAAAMEYWLRTAALPGHDTASLWRAVESACDGVEDLASGAALASQTVDNAAAEAV